MANLSPIAVCLLATIFGSGNAYAQHESNPPREERREPGKLNPGEPRADDPPEKIHRLESVTWDPMRCELTWVVSTGIRTGREYTPSEKQSYKIAMDTAVMQTGSERRRFEMKEAESVHLLMDMISRYAAESTIWWQNGQGEKIEERGALAVRQPNDAAAGRKPPDPSSAQGFHPDERPHAP